MRENVCDWGKVEVGSAFVGEGVSWLGGCSLYLLEVGMREWEKPGESRK